MDITEPDEDLPDATEEALARARSLIDAADRAAMAEAEHKADLLRRIERGDLRALAELKIPRLCPSVEVENCKPLETGPELMRRDFSASRLTNVSKTPDPETIIDLRARDDRWNAWADAKVERALGELARDVAVELVAIERAINARLTELQGRLDQIEDHLTRVAP